MQRHRKIISTLLIVVLAAGLMVVSGISRTHIGQMQKKMGYDNSGIAQDAPPEQVFTTVVLGGFKGLFVDFLWIRLVDLCTRHRFFEVVPIANWITALQPNFGAVWVFQSWNFAFNISKQFVSAKDRWNWIEIALDMLINRGLHYNPTNPQINTEIGWILIRRVARSNDEFHVEFKTWFIENMEKLFHETGYHPITLKKLSPDSVPVTEFNQKLRMQLVKMKQVNTLYGPLDWRLPATHAVYWAKQAMDYAPRADNFKASKTLQAGLYMNFFSGRLLMEPNSPPVFLPRPEILEKVNAYFESKIKEYETSGEKKSFQVGHCIFLQNATFMLYKMGMKARAQEAFDYVKKHYANQEKATSVPEFVKAFETSHRRFVN